ncbi:MAG: aspartyl protease family protein [Chitinophagaceae bacterium]|nr:aspartyl protease family protein [Chitinophagaceae bacterium]
MKRFILFFWIVFFSNCSQQHTQHLSDFYSEVPFRMDDGIFIEAVWDKDTIPTLVDNHSPSWINKKALEKIKATPTGDSYSTTTADGRNINGEVYEVKNVRIGNATFPSVSVYLIDNGSDRPAAVLGEDVLREGALKIDFKEKKLTLSNKDLDRSGAYEIKSNFNREGISLSVTFRENISEEIYLDIAYNNEVLLPANDFEKILKGRRPGKQQLQFSTPSGSQLIETSLIPDTINIDGKNFPTLLTSNVVATEKLIGLAFFRRFRYMIVDYRNKKLLVADRQEESGADDFRFLKNHDTTIVYSVDEISSEGSEVKVRYVNKFIRKAHWTIFEETGRREVNYEFFSSGTIGVTDKVYKYKTTFNKIESPNDIVLQDSTSYKLNFLGEPQTPLKDNFTNLYSELKANVPFVISENKLSESK